jgi:hypothetical protein
MCTVATIQYSTCGTVLVVQIVRAGIYSDGRSGAQVVFHPVSNEHEVSRVTRDRSGPWHECVVLAHVLGRRQQEAQ